MAQPNEPETVPADASQMTKIQKLAALLIILGPDSASQIMKQLPDTELEAISSEMAKLPFIGQKLQQDILREFAEVAVQASSGILGGSGFAQQSLERSVGLFRANDILNRIFPRRSPLAAMQQIAEMEPRHIYQLIRNEKIQTIALLLSYLSPELSARVLAFFQAEQRDAILERLATLDSTAVEVVEKVVEMLSNKRGNNYIRALNQTGGIKTAADLLNALEKNASKTLLINLEERNPELGQAIRQKMFTFEDLANLDKASLQKLLREVETRDLALALKNTSDSLKGTLLGCLSKRAAETVHEEISFLGPIKLKEIEAAQGRIVETVRRLEAEGEIDLSDANQNDPDAVLV